MPHTEYKYKYALVEDKSSFEDAYTFKSIWQPDEHDPDKLQWIFESAVEYFFHHNDGWEYKNWPYEFVVWDMQGKELGRKNMDMETVPRFFEVVR